MEENTHVLPELDCPDPVQPSVAKAHQNPHKVHCLENSGPEKKLLRSADYPCSLISEIVGPGHLVRLVSKRGMGA